MKEEKSNIRVAAEYTFGAVIGIGSVYLFGFLIPTMIATAAANAAATSITSAVGGWIGSSAAFSGIITNPIATVAMGEAYKAATALPFIGIGWIKTPTVFYIGYGVGKTAANYAIEGGKSIWNKIVSTYRKTQMEKKNSEELSQRNSFSDLVGFQNDQRSKTEALISN